MSSPPYFTGQRLTTTRGNLTVLTPTPSTNTTWQSATPRIVTYSTITVTAEAPESGTLEVSGPGGLTTLQRRGQEYLVIGIGPITPSSQSTDATPTDGLASQSPNKSGPTSRLPVVSSVTPAITPTITPTVQPISTPEATSGATSSAPLPARKTGLSDNAPKVVAGVMGGLFLLTLAVLLLLIFKLRKAAKDRSRSPQTMVFTETGSAKGQSTISELSARNTDLINQLEERNTQLSALQATLMRSNSAPPSLDDRSIASRFKQLEQELKDWVIIHFKSTEQRPDLSPELREILISQVPLFDRLLQQPRSRTMVLRAVAGYVFQKAFENGEFAGVGEGLGALERSMGRITSETEFNKWRSQTFLILSKASTTESKAQVVTTISQRIDSLLSPFSTTANQTERLHFLSRIVESAATLSLDLGCQLAKFKVLSEPAETPFHCAHMEDVYQEHETRVDPQTGKLANALDGRVIQAVVFPCVIKWGNERGENYDEMKVLLKATVLT